MYTGVSVIRETFQLWVHYSGEGWRMYEFYPTYDAAKKGIRELCAVVDKVVEWRVVVVREVFD